MTKPIIVIVDTNVLVYKTKLLKTPVSAALLYALKSQQGKLGFPEVLELELEKHFAKCVSKAISQVKNGYSELEIFMGVRDDYKLPTSNEINNRVKDRLLELEAFIIRMPFSLSNAKNALKRVIYEIPPNGEKNQQFKDSVIWENMLEYSEENDIRLITNDTGFFEGGKPDNGLATELKKEIENKTISIYFDIQDFLDDVKHSIEEIDKDIIADNLYIALEPEFTKFFKEKNIEIGHMEKYSIKTYLTESPSKMAVDYTLVVNILQKYEQESPEFHEVEAHIKGEAALDLDNMKIEKPQLSCIEIFDHDGNRLPGGLTCMSCTCVIGRKTIFHKFKTKNPFEIDKT